MFKPSSKADMIVGVDFGMTCSDTSVAWSIAPEWPEPRTIQRWPGRLGHELRNKVDTSVSYDLRTRGLRTWGFLCDWDDEHAECNSLFKLHLDPSYDGGHDNPITFDEATQWYEDYLCCLHSYITQYFSQTIPRFSRMKVDFVFSVPVTWRTRPALLAKIETIIRRAGFDDGNHSATVYLTEAEAAAIYASKQSLRKDDVFLVCDAGGGTTDINVLKVESAIKDNLELLPLSWTEGAAIGSTLIDFKIRKMILERLAAIGDLFMGDPERVVQEVMRDKFNTFKCSFGSAGMDVPKLLLPIPGVRAGLEIPHIGVEDSKIVIPREHLKAIFDDQVNKMTTLIDKQLQLVRQRHPDETVTYLVLSGGLGSSPYVQSQIREHYETDALARGIEGLEVLLASEPQLAVVHGLVASRVQASRGGPDPYALRCCPMSYGILCREEYNAELHQGEDVVQDPFDKKRWAERQIHWIMKQGQVVKADTGSSHAFRIKIPMGKEMEPWRTRVVVSSLPVTNLPQSMKRIGAREVCTIETVLSPEDMKRKNRHWYNLKDEYNRADFEVRVIAGTGLRFEVWSKDGAGKSRDHDELEVHWEAVDAEKCFASVTSPGFHDIERME